MKNKLILFFIILISIFFTGCSAIQIVEAENGMLDLSNLNFDDSTIYKMRGEWKIVWNEFLDPINDKEKIRNLETIIQIPNSWLETEIDGETVNSNGFGTLILDLKTDKTSNIDLAIESTYISSAFKGYINGNEIFSNGKPGQTLESSIEQWHPEIGYIHIDKDKDTNQFLIHFSGFTHRRFSIKDFYIGSKEAIEKHKFQRLYLDLFMFGLLTIMGLYHIGIFMMRKTDTASLWFGFLSLSISLRTIITGDRFINKLFPDISMKIFMKTAYLSIYLIIIFLVLYIFTAFNDKKITVFSKIVIISYILFIFATLILPLKIYDLFLLPFEIMVLLIFISIIHILINGVKKKKTGTSLMLLSILIFILASVNSILHENGIINSVSLVSFSFLFLLLSQSYILAKRMTAASILSEQLAKENMIINEKLTIQNKSLEKKVEIRTNEITLINEKLNTSNQELLKSLEIIDKSEKYFRSFFENLPIGIFKYSSKNGFLAANPKLTKLLKFPNVNELITTLNSNEYFMFTNKQEWFLFINELNNLDKEQNKKRVKMIQRDGNIITTELIYRLSDKNENELIIEGTISDISKQVAMEKKMHKHATTDSLTKLYNRHVFSDYMDNIKSGSYLFIIDIDNFKNINDTYGHDTGDIILIKLAETLTSICGSKYFVARIGGEEFAIIANDISESNIKLLANRILKAIRNTYIPYKFEKTITYTVSIGVSKTYKNMNNKDLFKLADNALYKSKDNGKNQVQYII